MAGVCSSWLMIEDNNIKNWCSPVKSILCRLGYNNIWENQFSMSKYEIDLFLRGLKNKIHSYYFNYWLSEINDRDKNPILRTYCSFKSHLKAEQYISCKIPAKYKRLIAQLRVSSHHLGIETGRHQKPVIPSNRRYCKFCPDQDAIDDEKHFILDCKFHIAERE